MRCSTSKPAPANSFAIYPNPASDWLTFDLGDIPDGQVRLAVYNLLGNLVWERQPQALREPLVQVSLRQLGLAEGLYLALAESSGLRQARMVLLIR